MKRTVLTFGLIAGAILSGMMFATLPLVDRISFGKLEIIGYTTMIAAFLMVFFGIRSYRENELGGQITFAKALTVGLLITLISCIMYVISWQIIYHKVTPDFVDKYANYMIEKSRAAGATETQLNEERQRMEQFKELYKNPLVNIGVTFLEPLPVGLPVTFLSAAILRKKR